MAEMLVRIVDKTNPEDPYLDSRLTKRGDVIAVQPDGWPWSAAERAGNPWAIVTLPGVDPEKLAGFLAEEPGDIKLAPHRRRGFRFDLDAWAAGGGKALAEAEGLALKAGKPALAPVDIGDDPNVIG
jgi:hypothetical protein